MMISTIHRHELAVGIHMSHPSCTLLPPLSPLHPSRLSQSTSFGFPYNTANSHWFSVLGMVMCIFQCFSLKSFHPLLPPWRLEICSLCLYLLCCLASRVINTIFLDSIYVYTLIYNVFLFLTYFTLYNRL